MLLLLVFGQIKLKTPALLNIQALDTVQGLHHIKKTLQLMLRAHCKKKKKDFMLPCRHIFEFPALIFALLYTQAILTPFMTHLLK